MRRNLLPYSPLIVLALSLILAPALLAAAGNLQCPTGDQRFLTVDPSGSNSTPAAGTNDGRQIAGDSTHDSTWFHGFYFEPVGDGSLGVDPHGSSTANTLSRWFKINGEDDVTGRCLDTSDVNHAHFLTEIGGAFTALDLTRSIGTNNLNYIGGIAGLCFKTGSDLISNDFIRFDSDFPDSATPRGAVPTGADNIDNFAERGIRHSILIRCFAW